MNPDLLERREKLLSLICKGAPLKKAIDELIKEIDSLEEREKTMMAMHRDWARRKTWLPQLVRLHDKTLFPELVAGMRQIILSAWAQYGVGDNTSAKVGALRTALKGYRDIIEVLQSIGAIDRIPIEITGGLHIGSLPFECDPAIKQILLETAATQKREKAEADAATGKEATLSASTQSNEQR